MYIYVYIYIRDVAHYLGMHAMCKTKVIPCGNRLLSRESDTTLVNLSQEANTTQVKSQNLLGTNTAWGALKGVERRRDVARYFGMHSMCKAKVSWGFSTC